MHDAAERALVAAERAFDRFTLISIGSVSRRRFLVAFCAAREMSLAFVVADLRRREWDRVARSAPRRDFVRVARARLVATDDN